ncbi:MAG: DUF1800 domain-containing protein [Chloroflexota bacterium]
MKQELARPSRRQFLRQWLPDTLLDLPQEFAETAVSQPQSSTLPEIGIIALNRMGYGPRPGDLAAFNALSATDQDRLYTYIDQQLDPDNITDTDFETRLAAANFATMNLSLSDMWGTYHRNPSGGNTTFRRTPTHELEVLTFMRAVYSKKQLFEVLANFWHNHFSIYAWNLPEAAVYMSYDRDVIRANTLGNFRTMMEAVAKSTAMLYYLDNYANKDSGPNENWARELLELHAMGAENYMGVADPATVPKDGNGVAVAFVDEDVFELTRAFTGWTVSNSKTNVTIGDSGEFYYRTDWHDYGEKTFLGQTIAANQPAMADTQEALDIIASHIGTARFVCRKLVRRLVNDNPPNDLVESAAALFQAQWQASDQLKQVVRHILRSDAFQTTWGMKMKRPFELAASALRAAEAEFAFDLVESNTSSLISQYDKIGQPLYAWHPPNGYPDVAAAWRSSTSFVMRWRYAAWATEKVDANGNHHLPINAQHPANLDTPNQIADYWIDRLLSRTIGSTERQKIIDFLAQDGDPNSPIDITSNKGLKHIRTLAILIMNSPDFQWK